MSWLARCCALTLVAVLADAAVASVHTTPIALGLAILTALAAAAGLALLWSRPWIALALGVTLLALAFAGGTFGGIAGGPALSTLPPSDAAAVALALCIAVAAAAVCVALRAMWACVLVLVAAAYGLVPTIASVGHGGLAAAFSSAPFAWTRGTYAAAEALLPLAAIVLVAYGFVEFGRRRAANGVAALLLAGGMAAATQLGAFAAGAAGLPTIVAFEHPSDAVSANVAAVHQPAAEAANVAPPASATETETVAPGSGPLFVPKGSQGVPPEVAAAAPIVAKDPAHALAAVASYADDLYPGALAGSSGALRSHSGNSVDKALLLRDLLRAANPSLETTFARCTLSADQADAIVARARAVSAHVPIVMQAAGAAAASATDPAVRARLQLLGQSWTHLVGDARDEGRKLSARLQSAGVALPTLPGADRLRALAADHVWLRAKLDGTWTDLDPTLAPAALGRTRCSAQSETATLPDQLYDVLGVRVVAEESNGTPRRITLLDRTFRTADLADRDVSFVFAEPAGLSDVVPAAASTPPPGADLFTPVLEIGDEYLTGTPLTLPPPLDGSIGTKMTAPVNAAAAAFGDAGASPSPVPSATPDLPSVSAVWLELTVAAPGATLTTVRSPLFDRIGYAARAAHGTPPPPLTAQLRFDDYRSLQTVWNVAVSGGHVAAASGPANVPLGAKQPPLGAALARLNGAYFQLRRALMDDARGSPAGILATQPGISLLALDNDGKLAVDLAGDSALPLTTEDARPLWAATSVLAERRLVTAPVRGGSAITPAQDDALFAFDYAENAGMKMLALHPGGASPAEAAIPDEARARMSDHLAHGATLLALAPDAAHGTGPATYAFWVADPATGTLRDENAFGRHEEVAGEAVTDEHVAFKNASVIRRLACRVAFATMVWAAQDSSWAEGQSFRDAEEAAEKAVDEEDPACGG
jgi:hypothetical protein